MVGSGKHDASGFRTGGGRMKLPYATCSFVDVIRIAMGA